jgi:hypothetical protein
VFFSIGLSDNRLGFINKTIWLHSYNFESIPITFPMMVENIKPYEITANKGTSTIDKKRAWLLHITIVEKIVRSGAGEIVAPVRVYNSGARHFLRLGWGKRRIKMGKGGFVISNLPFFISRIAKRY